MTITIERAKALKQALNDFVLDAEDDLATALESFSAAQLSQAKQTDLNRRDLVVDRFITEGRVNDQTPIERFIAAESDLSAAEQSLLQGWHKSFIGLFAVTQLFDDGLELMNWTTAKHYRLLLNESEQQVAIKLKAGDILLAQIGRLHPASDPNPSWMLLSKWISLGRLGKPKLAVAIGNFKQTYRDHLYSDAPELLVEAWQSVETYHQEFANFFGGSEVTLPGYQLAKKLSEFQTLTAEKQLAKSGLDGSKSLQDVAEETGVSEAELQAELAEAAAALGADAKRMAQVMQSKQPAAMVSPKVELPPHLKKAEQVTILTHPRWGQVFLTDYAQLQATIAADSDIQPYVQKYLQDPEIPTFVLQALVQQHPQQMETALQAVSQRSDFQMDSDLEDLLRAQGKSLTPELPEIASVPLHLHHLFQAAVVEVSKDRPKKQAKSKAAGFGRS
ncbi:MAG: hypothetical protein KME07_08140 [Pegethrix bostrychoides GSE-TBD4-15B]|jgi:hypothetical protein|uniref:Uncharacterized protein n=1 Tax=Pegethrix bostrychoides GSE-TBD4-15B TaxID=2839662 RepID=A0A951PAI3_9CYAN|nr:hypothetical protein [Pegethrix bostrychoides GSE-TBD4-15B]